jgi:hypothetical protein
MTSTQHFAPLHRLVVIDDSPLTFARAFLPRLAQICPTRIGGGESRFSRYGSGDTDVFLAQRQTHSDIAADTDS